MCEQCQARIEALKAAGRRASELYEVGNPARNQMGHEMYFSTEGRTSLCSAKRREG